METAQKLKQKAEDELVTRQKFESLFKKVKEGDTQCEACKKVLKNTKALRNHLKTHMRKKNLKCPYCDSKFSYDKSRKVHINAYHKKKDKLCDQCDAAFVLQCQLVKHMEIHSSPLERTCSTCRREFTTKTLFERHLKYDSKTNKCVQKGAPPKVPKKTFVCHLCQAQVQSLTDHLQIVHYQTLGFPLMSRKLIDHVTGQTSIRMLKLCNKWLACERVICQISRL